MEISLFKSQCLHMIGWPKNIDDRKNEQRYWYVSMNLRFWRFNVDTNIFNNWNKWPRKTLSIYFGPFHIGTN